MTAHAVCYAGTWTVEAGGQLPIHINAEFVFVRAASQAEFGLGMDQDGGGRAYPGARWRTPVGVQYTRLTLVNESVTDPLTVTILYGFGDFDLQQFKFIPAGGLSTPARVTVPAGEAAMIIDTNLNRRSVKVQNLFANARELLIGDSTVSAVSGWELPPGEKEMIQSTSAVWAYNPHTADLLVAVMEITE